MGGWLGGWVWLPKCMYFGHIHFRCITISNQFRESWHFCWPLVTKLPLWWWWRGQPKTSSMTFVLSTIPPAGAMLERASARLDYVTNGSQTPSSAPFWTLLGISAGTLALLLLSWWKRLLDRGRNDGRRRSTPTRPSPVAVCPPHPPENLSSQCQCGVFSTGTKYDVYHCDYVKEQNINFWQKKMKRTVSFFRISSQFEGILAL